MRAAVGAGHGIALHGVGAEALGPVALGDNADEAMGAGRPVARVGEPPTGVLDPYRRGVRPLGGQQAVDGAERHASARVAAARTDDRLVARGRTVGREVLGVADARRQRRAVLDADRRREIGAPPAHVADEIPIIDDLAAVGGAKPLIGRRRRLGPVRPNRDAPIPDSPVFAARRDLHLRVSKGHARSAEARNLGALP